MKEEKIQEDRVAQTLAVLCAALILALAVGAAIWSCVLEHRYPPPIFHGIPAANSEPGGGVGR